MRNQETEGILSPWLMNMRLRTTATRIVSGSSVLDLACGSGALKRHLPPNCKYYGVDRIEPDSRENFDEFLCLDILSEDAFSVIADWLPENTVEVVTAIAFIEHIVDHESVLSGLRPLLSEEGKFLATTPHPIGRNIHDFLAKVGICSPSGAEEHEDFLGERDLDGITRQSNFKMTHYRKFLFGLNQLAEARPVST